MVEKDAQVILGNYIQENRDEFPETCAIELKMEKDTISIRYDRVAEHQIEALKNAKNGGVYHKINDHPWGKGSQMRFTQQKPFDCFFIREAKAYVVVLFYKPYKTKEFIFIDVDEWLKQWDNDNERKSMRIKTCKEIAERVIKI